MFRVPGRPVTPPVPVSHAERARLETCVREPIRIPGSTQPYGVVLTADPATWTIVQASENTADIVGRSAPELLGTPLAELLGRDTVDRLAAVLRGDLGAANPVPLVLDMSTFDVLVHTVDGVAVVELEPAQPAADFTAPAAVYAALASLSVLSSREQLWETTARELHRLTGFDRVMVYHFHPDGHGQVVAEQRSDDTMEAYLGLHYPASDIPAQARALYLTKVSRTIASTLATACRLLPAENPVTGHPLDLSGAELRSVSPHHLDFMRNMGQAATVSFSLIVGGELVGMITCAHRTPRRLPYPLRRALEVFAGQAAVRLDSMAQISALERATEVLAVRKRLVEQVSASSDLPPALLSESVSLFDLVPARTVALRHDGHLTLAGDPLDRSQVEQFVQRMFADGGRLPFVSEALASEHPALAQILPDVAGVLMVPFGSDGDFLAWFRPEITETIEWLGDQSESNRDSTLSPRNSFHAWSRSVSGISEPWGPLTAEAGDFGVDLDSTLHRMKDANLARFALHDPLTGLPNRRLLLDRVDHALAGHTRGNDTALLFVDIDSFKLFNDSLGHAGGDMVLAQIAERLLASARPADTVSRLGGDEFVVICENTDLAAARVIAERLLAALRLPLSYDGDEVSVTASIGIAVARAGDTAAGLIRRADASMYRAKRDGKDRAGE